MCVCSFKLLTLVYIFLTEKNHYHSKNKNKRQKIIFYPGKEKEASKCPKYLEISGFTFNKKKKIILHILNKYLHNDNNNTWCFLQKKKNIETEMSTTNYI